MPRRSRTRIIWLATSGRVQWALRVVRWAARTPVSPNILRMIRTISRAVAVRSLKASLMAPKPPNLARAAVSDHLVGLPVS